MSSASQGVAGRPGGAGRGGPNFFGDDPSQERGDRQPSDSSPSSQSQTSSSSSSSIASAFSDAVSSGVGLIGKLLLWLIVAAVAGALVYLLWKYRDEFAAWLRGLWPRKKAPQSAAAQEHVAPAAPPKPFAAYADPFATGIVRKMPVRELVRYSFTALEAWSREQGHERGEDETALELAREVGSIDADLAVPARHLADLYSQAAYAPTQPLRPDETLLRQLWTTMRQPRAESLAVQA